jgi:hypothetical protein
LVANGSTASVQTGHKTLPLHLPATQRRARHYS